MCWDKSDKPQYLYINLLLHIKTTIAIQDLGMIELHPDPDDPNRDRSKDDEDIWASYEELLTYRSVYLWVKQKEMWNNTMA